MKGGIVTWETQQTDYPRTRADMPNHEPRGCSRGASYSWYPYSANRLNYPLVRSALVELCGGVCLSFYDWYCDLPPASPQTWGERTDVPESADWYNSTFIVMWGSNVPQTRTPDAHFLVEARYRGTKVVSVFPDYSEGAKFGDLWLHPKQGTDAALALAMGHVILKEFHVAGPGLAGKSDYFVDYCKRYTDMPCLMRLVPHGDGYVPERLVRASDFDDALGEAALPEWKSVMIDDATGEFVVPVGSVGFRRGQQDDADTGKWNLRAETSKGAALAPRLSCTVAHDEVVDVLFPYFGNQPHAHFNHTPHQSEPSRRIGVRRVATRDGEVLVATVYDLFIANYGLDQGLGGRDVATSYDDLPYTPAWQEAITGVKRADVISVARQFAENAHKTQGKSMVIIGAGVNHWFHMDMSYRAIINMLIMCGCVGKPGGGWSHYVGQEKLRPPTGWTALAFALGMASTFKYVADDFPDNMGVVTAIVGLAGGLGGFLLPILFGMLLDLLRVRTTCFMFLYGIVWVSLILIYLSEVRRKPIIA